jgi:serine/threonine-protein phosphatase 2A regulatory subunit B''
MVRKLRTNGVTGEKVTQMSFEAYCAIKVCEFFTNWITGPSVLPIFHAIRDAAKSLAQGRPVDFDFSVISGSSFSRDSAAPLPVPMPSLSGSESSVRLLRETSSRPSVDQIIAGVGSSIAHFYGPIDNAPEEEALVAACQSLDNTLVGDLLETYCELPSLFAPILIEGHTPASLESFWRTNLLGQDPNYRLLRIAAHADRDLITPDDLMPFVRSIVTTHQSLQFLQEQAQFLGQFVEFVCVRLFLLLDPELRGTAAIHQLRNVNLASIFFDAFKAEDLNEARSLFSYQGFYVTFCKFWDLDLDGDGFLTRDDLLRFNEGSVSPIIINRFVTSPFFPRGPAAGPRIDFRAFAYFLICTEDKKMLASIYFWFRLCDLDDDGLLSLHEIEKLYDIQFERMSVTGNETIPFDDVLRQMIDVLMPENPAVISIQDLIKCKQPHVFLDTLIDLHKFLVQEYQNPEPTFGQENPLTPWQLFAVVEYGRLVNDS